MKISRHAEFSDEGRRHSKFKSDLIWRHLIPPIFFFSFPTQKLTKCVSHIICLLLQIWVPKYDMCDKEVMYHMYIAKANNPRTVCRDEDYREPLLSSIFPLLRKAVNLHISIKFRGHESLIEFCGILAIFST